MKMNLLNEEVRHIKFGTGIIKTDENGIIRVQFSEEFGEKAFIYPTAFEQFLKFNNPLLDKNVQNEILQIIPEKIRLIREEERLKEKERRIKLEQSKLKVKAAKAKAAKAAKKEKDIEAAESVG